MTAENQPRHCQKCGNEMQSNLSKDKRKELTAQAISATISATVFIALGNNMKKTQSSIVAMSAAMGRGRIYLINTEAPNMKIQHRMSTAVINEDPHKFVDLLMNHFDLQTPAFQIKKHLKLSLVDNVVQVFGIDESLND